MGSNLGELVATASLDIAPFVGNTKQLSMYMRGLDKSLNAMEKSFKNAGNGAKNLGGMRTVLAETGKSIQAYEGILKKQTDHYNELKSKIGDFGTASAKNKEDLLSARNAMLQTATTISDLKNRYVELTKEINIQSSSWTKIGSNLTSFGDRMKGIGAKVSGVGSALTKGVTAPLVADAGIAIKAAIDYESAFAGVKKTVDATEGEYQKMSRAIREASKVMPASAVDIAKVAESAGQLGIKKQNIVDFSKTMIDLGESTNLTADEAATSLARLANITQMPQSEFRRLGSTIVDLGNNFATTEKEIVEMSLRLAGTGKLVGLTEPQILAVATAMSSVGINAEAGGSSFSRVMQKINTQVLSSGDKLEKFAQVAGMSAENFAKSWKTEPQIAMLAFLDGLKKVKASGGDVTQTLKQLGIKSTQEIDTMQRMAGAGDLLSRALKTANGAWKENNALTTEAKKRYETTESQLKIFKNKLTDIAIEFGGPLLKALNSGLDATKPWLQTLSDMAKKFSEMSREQQQNVIKWGLMAAAIGPALKLLGGGLSIIGGFTKGLGSIASGIGKFSGLLKTFKDAGSIAGGFKALSAGIGGVGTATAEANASAGLLSSTIATLGSVPTWGILVGGAALIGLGYITKEITEANERTERWGTSVSKLQDEQLGSFKAKVDEANKAMVDFGATAGSVDNVKASFEKLNSEIDKLIDEKKEKLQALAKEVGMSEEVRKNQEEQLEQTKVNVRNMTEEVGRIYQNAKDHHRDLTIEEKAIVSNIQNQMISQELDLLNISKDKKHAIMQAMNGDVKSMNETQRQDALKVVTDWILEEEKVYEKRKQAIKDAYRNDGSEKAIQERNQKLDELEAEHLARKEAYQQKYFELEKNFLDNYNGRWTKEALGGAKSRMGALGLDVKQFEEYMRSAADTVKTSSGIVAKSLTNMSQETAEANLIWNSLVFDDKKGEVKTNAVEEVQKALEAEGGWESMQFVLKNANLETNAKMVIGQALVEAGKWDSLSVEEKELVLDGHKGMQAILENKEALAQWNALPVEVKEMLMKNEAVLNSGKLAISTLQKWNQLSPEQKEIIAKDLATGEVTKIQQALNLLVGMNPNIPIDATDNSSKVISQVMNDILNIPKETNTNINADASGAEAGKNQALEAYGAVNAYQVLEKSITANADNAVQQGQKAIDKQTEWNATPSPTKQQTGDASSAVNAGQSAINKQNEWNALYSPTKYMLGDATSAVNAANSASGAIQSIPTSWHTTITATEVVNRVFNTVGRLFGHKNGTNYHQGGFAMVNDQEGPMYKELVTLPNGQSFIPHGRNVVLDLPRGSKVLRAGLTKNLMNSLGMPNYANGVGWEKSKIANITQRIKNVNEWKEGHTSKDVTPFLEELIRQVKNGNQNERPNQNYTLNVNSSGNNQELTPEFMKKLLRELAYYTNQEGGKLA